MSFHDRIFGDDLEEQTAMSDGYDHGPYKSQFTQGPKATSLFVLPREGSWPVNSIHVHNSMQGNVRGVGREQGDPNYGQKNEAEDRLAESMDRLRSILDS